MREELSHTEISAILGRAKKHFLKFPGVVGVGYGLKQIDDETTSQVCLHIYVKQKVDAEELSPEFLIPEKFEGQKTDVVLPFNDTLIAGEDFALHRPLIGGITISNMRKVDENDPLETFDGGTLGFFATINGNSGPNNIAIVSNHHVMMSRGGSANDIIYQPNLVPADFLSPIERNGPIGKIENAGKSDNHDYAYPSEAKQEYFVDCAIAKLDTDISSWCGCHSGVSYKNEIRDLNISGNSKIEGFARADATAVGDRVFKVGRRTGRTEGIITRFNASASGGTKKNVLGIEGDGGPFANHGDSGSAIINEQNKIIGLLYAMDGNFGVACHIHPVLDALQVTPISRVPNPPIAPAGIARSNISGFISEPQGDFSMFRERFIRTSIGKTAYPEIMRHKDEIIDLVNHCRPVTIMWHRYKGPAFVSHIMHNSRHPDHPIPYEIEGIDRNNLLEAMAEALSESGSQDLRSVIARYRTLISNEATSFEGLDTLISRFETRTEKESFDA